MYVPIIDVSHWQGQINWTRVAQSNVHSMGPVKGAYIKATEHTERVDPRFSENWSAALRAGLYVGAYHFARPSGPDVVGDATAEAKHFVRTIRALYTRPGARLLPPMLDLEVTQLGQTHTTEWMLVFLRHVHKEIGRIPVVYTGAYTPFTNSQALAAYPLWLARYPLGYQVHPDPTKLSPPRSRPLWTTWSIWQYTSSGRIGGVSGNVDLNVVKKDWWAKITGAATTPVPRPPAPNTGHQEVDVTAAELRAELDRRFDEHEAKMLRLGVNIVTEIEKRVLTKIPTHRDS